MFLLLTSGCMLLTRAMALEVNCEMREPYSIVSFWLIVLLIAMPLELTTIIP